MFIVGHTLVWHNQTPRLVLHGLRWNSPTRPCSRYERLRSHIQAVAGRYAGRINAWDVVNEVIGDDGTYRPTTWVKGIGDGDELVTLAFRYASEYAPNTELYYNDFNAWRPAKRDGIVRLVRMLKKQGIRIDGVGMQGHWGLNYPETRYIEAAIDSFAARGREGDDHGARRRRPAADEGRADHRPGVQPSRSARSRSSRSSSTPIATACQTTSSGNSPTRYAELFRIF